MISLIIKYLLDLLDGPGLKESVFFNKLAVRDIANHEATIDLSNQKLVNFMVYTTLDEPISIQIRQDGGAESHTAHIFWDNEKWVTTGTGEGLITLTNAFGWYSLNSIHPQLSDLLFKNVTIRVFAETAPTTGTITVISRGKPL